MTLPVNSDGQTFNYTEGSSNNVNKNQCHLLKLICLPPSVVISQKTFNGFSKLPGSIQYSPSPTENPLSKRCLQDFPGVSNPNPRPTPEKRASNLQ